MDDMEDPRFLAAIEASRKEARMGSCPAPPPPDWVVDLTHDSDSDIEEVFPKSKSVVSSSPDPMDADHDDYDETELQKALALSVEPNAASPMSEDSRTVSEISKSKEPATLPSVPFTGIQGLDRKKMEEERLARLASRKAQESGPSPTKQLKRKAEDSLDTPVQSRRKVEAALPAVDNRTAENEVVDLDCLKIATNNAEASSVVNNSSQLENTTSATTARNPPTGRTMNSRLASAICRRYDSNAPDVKIWPTSRPLAQWPLGAIKKTYIAGFPRVGTEITIEEVIQRDDLQLAVFSGFMWEMEWFFKKLDTASTRFVLMMQANDQETKDEYLNDVAAIPNLRLCFPPMEPQVFCMHSKLMLLFHADYLRIAIPTANPTSTDWGENGLMENTVFLIDLPKIDIPLSEVQKTSETHNTQFYTELVYYLEACTLHSNIIDKLKGFDFTETKRYAFVHSIGGSNTGERWKRTGCSGLGLALQNLGLATESKLNIDYIVGVLRPSYVLSLMMTRHPRWAVSTLNSYGLWDDGTKDYELRTGSKKDPERKRMSERLNAEALARMRVYFPSDQTVNEAHEHPNHTAGTICFNARWWTNPAFPRALLRDCESERGVLMHNKIAFVRPAKPINLDEKTECSAWAYVGSANLSESAWYLIVHHPAQPPLNRDRGRLVKDSTTKNLKMNCRNWECGVIVPIRSEKKPHSPSAESESAPFPTEHFQDIIPVPMRVPAAPLSETRKPFFFGV
ncbi:unnamed protein product [Penicillium salamii]|uniref:PLD phosphodiesterase domain-containing protein n=1 Tax=Penicillium salamii TaxID=1612424 RepID=A0A9W4IVR8_9EURO|nr:unnamed protein product [Penicillium salamii]CAG8363632.1 unnamed protein product [Penicillium salamii]CAG8365169.1 unnamed protein product [Penicillium salamii]CAG8384993.1 unnamed protein product [Penicillium salamii]